MNTPSSDSFSGSPFPPGHPIEEKSDDASLPERTKRRKKELTNNEKRIFICGCGKNYLSYPALYTHLKQKHNSHVPDGTQFPNTLGKGKKGRPKNSDKVQIDAFHDDQTDLSEESVDPLTEIVYYLKGKTFKKEENFCFGSTEQKYDLIQSFPLTLFKENIEDFLSIYNNLKVMIEQKAGQRESHFFIKTESTEPPDDDLFETRPLTCNKIFSTFLMQISIYVNRDIYRELCIFVCLYRKVLNKHGWNVKQQLLQKQGYDTSRFSEDYMNKEFCQENDGELIPTICNLFMSESIVILQTQLKDQEYLLLGGQKSKDKNNSVLYLTNHFINWLYNKGYTSQRVSFDQSMLDA